MDRSTSMGESGDSHLAVNSAGELEEPKSMFSPPLYYQRYSAVEDIIQHHQAEYGDDIQSVSTYALVFFRTQPMGNFILFRYMCGEFQPLQ